MTTDKQQPPARCPRCSDLLLFNNRTAAGVCDNCWSGEVEKLQRRLAKKYGKGKSK